MVERRSGKDKNSTFKQRTASWVSNFPFCRILKVMGANWWHGERFEMEERLLSRFRVLLCTHLYDSGICYIVRCLLTAQAPNVALMRSPRWAGPSADEA